MSGPLPARRLAGSIVTTATIAGLAAVTASVLSVALWIGTLIATCVIVAAMVVRGRF